MGSGFFQRVKSLIVKIVRLFVDRIAELHISGGKVSVNVNLRQMIAMA